MTVNNQAQRVQQILWEALKLSGDARLVYLETACGGDSELRREVESLLEAEGQAGTFLFPQPRESGLAVPLAEKAGDHIGRYKLIEKIGEGGFGVVWKAEQEEPVHRRVALKIIKLGMDTKEVVARFEAERQALAMLDHPNIARVLDAGSTPAGRPYFVMELINGPSITDFCDREKLTTQDRLRLFTKVCHAVQHAHQKGIIHRDIKPTNVLVTVHDAEPVPKVIDFGVAKALGHKLTEKTLLTSSHHLIGTPAYMSPEQADPTGLDVDTRTDIYSLGVLLYELLTGLTPLDRTTLGRAAIDEIRRIICEREPLKPSTRLAKLPKEQEVGLAARRGVDTVKLSRLLRGDLDWIVMKALEKDQHRRYPAVLAFIQDVERHLRNEPISAAAPSLLYRTGKFVRRHRTAFIIASIAVIVVLSGAGAAVHLTRRAKNAEQAKAKMGSFVREFLGDSLEQRVTNVLSQEDLQRRLSVISGLRENMPDETHEMLLSLLKSPDSKIRRRAASALARFGAQNARKVEVLADQFENNPDPVVRLGCGSALMSIPGEKADRAYERAVFDSDEKVVRLACSQLSFRAPPGHPSLFLLLTNHSWSVRQMACAVLVQQKVADARVVATVEALSREPEAAEFAKSEATYGPSIRDWVEKQTGQKPEDWSLENLLKQARDQANTNPR